MFPNTNPIMMALLGGGPMNPQAPRQLRPQPMPPMDMGEQVPPPSYAQRIAKMQAGGGFNPQALEFMAQNQELLERMYQQEGGKATGDWIRSQAGRTPEGQQAFNQAWNDADAISGLMDAPSAESSAAVENLKRQAASRGKTKAMKNYRTSGFNPQTAVPQKYQQKYSDMLGLNQLDAGQALQGGRSASGQPLRGLTQQLQGPSDYDPAAPTAHRDQMYDRWSNNQGAANGTRNVFSKFSSPAPDANGNMVDMPGIKIQSARAALAESIENDPNASESQKQTAAQIRKQQREEGLLSSAQSGVRELRRKARALGEDPSKYKFLAEDATPEQIRQAMDANMAFESGLDFRRKNKLRATQQQRAEAMAMARQNEAFGRLPLQMQAQLYTDNLKLLMAREEVAARLKESKGRTDAANRETDGSVGISLIQAGEATGNQDMIDQGYAIINGLYGNNNAPASQGPGLPTPEGIAGSITPQEAARSKSNLDSVAPGLSATVENTRTPDELRKAIREIYPNVSIAEFHQLYQEALNVKLGNATAAERKKWNDQEKAWSRREAARAMGPILPPSSAYMTGGGSSFNDYPANGIGF